jgi:hypothetical protein
MTLRHHLVTMTNGESLAKTNQRTIHSLITFLVWIVFFHSTSSNAFVFGIQASRRSPKMPSKTIQLPNDSPAKQHLVPNDDSALTILQICIPTTTISTGLQASNNCHSSLNDVTAPQAFPTTTATMTATMTQVPAITTAITKGDLFIYLALAKTALPGQFVLLVSSQSKEKS